MAMGYCLNIRFFTLWTNAPDTKEFDKCH